MINIKTTKRKWRLIVKEFHSCKSAIDFCLANKYFALAHLYHDEKPMNMHIHDCYELYFSISGGKQFLIDSRFYTVCSGDIFFINQFESHHLTQIDKEIHERIVLSIYPDYLKQLSSFKTDLSYCFFNRNNHFGHKISLSLEEQKRFLFFVHKITSVIDYGIDLLEQSYFIELMVFLNGIFHKREKKSEQTKIIKSSATHEQVDHILTYINQNITTPLTIEQLSKQFYLSSSYLCRIFKESTGMTINKYIIAKRITIAKSLLAEGYNVNEACEQCGFHDYSNFLKAFTKAVGISPKKYAQYSS